MDFKISIFTVRKKDTKELIYASGVPHDEMYLDFKINKDNFSEEELDVITVENAWHVNSEGKYYYDEEIRHLLDYEYDKIEFNIEEVLMIDVNINENS